MVDNRQLRGTNSLANCPYDDSVKQASGYVPGFQQEAFLSSNWENQVENLVALFKHSANYYV